VISREDIRSIDPAVYRASQLEIKAKPEWNIAARQAYYQIKPVPTFDNPVQVGNFLLWADPEPEYIDIFVPPSPWIDKITPAEPPIFREPLPDRVVTRPPLDRVVDRVVTRPPLDRVVVKPGLERISRMQMLVPIATNIRAVKIPTRRAFFASTVPAFKSAKLTIQQAVQNGSIQITGGTAILTIGIYTQENVELLEQYRSIWTDALLQAGYGSRIWKFLPVSMRGLHAILEMDTALLSSRIKTNVNSNWGTVTFIIELSALGAQVWKAALERGQAYSIPGAVQCTTKYYAQYSDRIDIQQRVFSASLGSLLANCGTEIMEVLNPLIAVETKILVQGNSIVDRVDIDWIPNTQDAPLTRSFDTTGGLLAAPVNTRDVGRISVNWKAIVKFKTASWSAVPQAGTLSPNTSFVEIIKPSSWIREYTLITLLMENANQITTDSSQFNHLDIEATFTFSAPYLQNGVPLTTTFNPAQTITTVPFPLSPGQLPTQVGLVITTKSKVNNQLLNSSVRVLQEGETLISAKIFKDGRVEIYTTADVMLEKSIESDVLSLVAEVEMTSHTP
jgi:hypothetical protein